MRFFHLEHHYKYILKLASSVLPIEKKQLRKLTIRDVGIIWDAFKCYCFLKDCYVVLVWDHKTIVAWALIIYKRYGIESPSYDFSIYVRKSFRYQGIGRNVYNLVKKELGLTNENLDVHRHDNQSRWFYNKIRNEQL